MPEVFILTAAILVMALLYSSVGHGGGSGYLAAMALLGVAPEVMRPTALTLNVLVAGIATVQFYRAGYFSWRTFLPFAVASIPLAYVGGMIHLSTSVYKPLVGLVLLFAAYRLWLDASAKTSAPPRMPPTPVALSVGAGIGLLSGLTGVGGGIFLSPLLLLMNWADVRRAAAVSAAFVLVNSVAGLAGNVAGVRRLPGAIFAWGAAAVVGGVIGSELGRRRLATLTLRRLLSVVLVVAGLKLIFG
ncbi:MAG TPA: sulfite exporter TauE/SafE family protein [Pyrinomonadaceae bacterium]|nr:sulfite exporter TauE/SafE family protein [Pyrinomonadaceae bacterium]